MKKSFAIVLTGLMLTGMLVFFIGSAGGESEELYFTVLHTNDEHSTLLPSPYVDFHPEENDPTLGGMARLSTLVSSIRDAKNASGEPVVLVSAGDYVGGSPYCWLIPGGEAPELSLLQKIGYDVVTIGNHEFDYGPDYLAGYFKAAGYPDANGNTALLSANIVIPEGHPLNEAEIKDVHVIELDNGLKLGFFGLLGNDAAELASAKAPIDFSDSFAAAEAAVQKLKGLDADLIIAVTHVGLYEDQAIAAAVPGIDIMVTGHCHTALEEPIYEGETILVQSGVRLHNLGVIELAYNPVDGKLRVRNEDNDQPFLMPLDDSVPKDPEMVEAISVFTEKLNDLVSGVTGGKVADIKDIILYSDFVLEAGPPLQESIFGNFLTDAMRFIVEEKTGEKVDFAIQANGVIRGDVIPGRMAFSKNNINFYDFVTTIGLGMGSEGDPGYPLTSIYITGNEIYRVLEITTLLTNLKGDTFFPQISGGRYTYDPERSIVFQIPFTDLPLPSLRAILKLEQFTGNGLQTADDADYRRISRSDNSLYHVICDSYVLSFLPIIEEMLPFYPVVPKDSDGNAIDLEDAVIYVNGEEISFWLSAVEYALQMEKGDHGIPVMPAYYASTGERAVRKDTLPVIFWPVVVLVLIIIFIVFLVKRHKEKQLKQ